jgi:hypothetical protein
VSVGWLPSSIPLTSCTAIRSRLYFASSLATVWVNLLYNIPCSKSHIHFSLPVSIQRNLPNRRRFVTFINKLYFTVRSSYPSPNPESGGPAPVGSTWLLIQYIRSYPPYLDAISPIRNPRTRHTVVTRTHITCVVKTGRSLISLNKLTLLNIRRKIAKHELWQNLCHLSWS